MYLYQSFHFWQCVLHKIEQFFHIPATKWRKKNKQKKKHKSSKASMEINRPPITLSSLKCPDGGKTQGMINPIEDWKYEMKRRGWGIYLSFSSVLPLTFQTVLSGETGSVGQGAFDATRQAAKSGLMHYWTHCGSLLKEPLEFNWPQLIWKGFISQFSLAGEMGMWRKQPCFWEILDLWLLCFSNKKKKEREMLFQNIVSCLLRQNFKASNCVCTRNKKVSMIT